MAAVLFNNTLTTDISPLFFTPLLSDSQEGICLAHVFLAGRFCMLEYLERLHMFAQRYEYIRKVEAAGEPSSIVLTK